MSPEHQWTDNDRRKTKYSEKFPFQCQFAHFTSNMERPGTEPVPVVRGRRLTV